MNRIKPCICSGIRRYCKTCGENQALYLYKSRYWREGIKPCACTNAGTGERESSPVLLQTQVLEGPVTSQKNQALSCPFLYKHRYWKERIKSCTCTKASTGNRESSPVLVYKRRYWNHGIKPCTCTKAGTGRTESSPVLVQKQVLEGPVERIKPCLITNCPTGH